MPTSSAYELAHLSNLLGAFVTTINDELTLALEDEVEAGGAVPAALLAIDTWPGCSIEFLCGVLGLTHSGTVRLVARLESAGFAERRRGADARTVALRLTPQGRMLMRRVRQTRRRVLDRVVTDLSQSEQRLLGTVLDRVLRRTRRSRVQAQNSCRLCDHTVCRDDACPIGSSAGGV